MHRKARTFVLLLAVIGSAGCKKKSADGNAEVLREMTELKDRMCACKDKACVDTVQEALTRWSAEAARSGRPAKPDERTMKAMTSVGQDYGKCMAQVMSASVPAPAPEVIAPTPTPPTPEPPTPPPLPAEPPTPSSRNADVLLRQARDWAAKARPDRFVRQASFSYLDAEGLLDPSYGEVEVTFGRVYDTPNRRMGAPVRPTTTKHDGDDCLSLTIVDGRWKINPYVTCEDTIAYVPRCTTTDIWKRAIAQKAPAEALAVIYFDTKTKNWLFRIKDEPMKVNFKANFPDDCELAVEQQ